MDISTLAPRLVKGASVNSLTDLPEYIITTFFPGSLPLLKRYPRFFRFLGILLAFYYFGPVARIKDLWDQCSSMFVSSVNVSSDEDLFGYMVSFIDDKTAIRPNLAMNAITNPLQDNRRSRHDPDYEESAQKNARQEHKVKFEQGKGMQIFIHRRRVFWVHRGEGEGHTYYGNRYRRQEVLKFSCLGRSTQPIKDLMQDIYKLNKDKEKSLTVIRRPYAGGYGSRLTWSRLTAKRRRQLDTVILQETQTSAILADVEEYMSEATKTFYADHGIPYRRGYLFHGPPGCGKTSFCLALAAKFDLDVYILTLLDKDLTDTDLMSLLNQLPTPSLLLLEDIDEAGLNRKSKAFAHAQSRKNKSGLPEGALDPSDDTFEDEEEETRSKTNVTLSGLLNAIDGVAAPEGHILIMTTNKPHELDDALVRAGRISVHVQFSNANQKQAEQIFLRMYVDHNKRADEFVKSGLDMDDLARQFGEALQEGAFSPADLQDYLLIHKRDPIRAVSGQKKWMEEKVKERKRKEEEKEAEIRWKIEKAAERRKKYMSELKKAFAEGGEEKAQELMEEKEKEAKDKKKEKSRDYDSDD